MCGFVGFIDQKNKTEKKKHLNQMLETIIHRGPDSQGTYIDSSIALGFRRLSIIDLNHGSQPMYNEDETIVVLFNGEIYNFKEIRKTLIEKGHEFKTQADTEILVHGYEEYGKKIVTKLRGMFSFVVWDIEKKELFGARDPFGIKPFYYGKMGDTFFFGSEIKSFLPHPDFHKKLNKEALKPYLTFQYSALNETFFKGIFKLEPGHMFSYQDGKMNIESYYEYEYNQEEKSIEEYMDEIELAMKESVKYHKISDVKVGSFLSGGIDSSYITKCLMPDQTFSVGFRNEGFSEVDYAKDLSEQLGIENVSELIKPDEFFKEVPSIQYHSDEPHANLSAVPLYFLSKLAKKHVTVVLSGEGADELFGGYDNYNVEAQDLKYRKWPSWIRRSLGKLVLNAKPFHGRNFLIRNGLEVEEYYIGQAFIFNEKEAVSILKGEYRYGKTIREITKPYFDQVKDKSDLEKMQYLDMHLWLPNDILLKADKMTMAHSLELRVPFLDKKVFDLAAKIPVSYKIKDGQTKYVLRQAALKQLPEEWAKRPKVGFPVPFADWIKEEKYYKKIKNLFDKKFVQEFFDQEKILKLLEDHYQQRANNGRKIWTVYTFLIWYKVYFIDMN